MNADNSILDKIIESKQLQEASQFDPSELLFDLFKNLSTKERDILNRRFGLLGKEKETLEQIGTYYEITRERIRQIEATTIKRLKELETFRQNIEGAEHNVTHLLEHYGGIMEENHLLEELLAYAEPNEANRQASLFILLNLLDDKINRLKGDSHFHPGWKLPSFSTDVLESVLSELTEAIDHERRLYKTEEVVDLFKNHKSIDELRRQVPGVELEGDSGDAANIEKAIHSYLTISKNINKNILGEWGLAHWNTVLPKRMGDKVYLVLRKAGKPLHFTEITDLINQAKFDDKIAYPATIHNELILDDRYILVGRGIYALKEWGYQAGTVLDVVADILREADAPLTKEDIIDRVLSQRLVRKSTILLALTNKERIKKLSDGTYALVEKPAPQA